MLFLRSKKKNFSVTSSDLKPDKLLHPYFPGIFVIYVSAIVLVYGFLHMNYRPYNVDDGWSLSYLYNYVHHGITADLNFGDPMNGVRFFGKSHAFLVGFVLDLIGWTRTNGHILSILFMGGALLSWFFILRKLGYSIELVLSFVFASFLLDPFFTAATSTRTEAFEFLLITLSTGAFLLQWYEVSILIAWLAIESHPIGVISFFYLGAVFFSSAALRHSFLDKKTSGLLRTLSAFFLGFLGFFLLHHEALGQFQSLLSRKNIPSDVKAYGPLFCYFFETKYYRHLPELALFGTAFLVFIKKGLYRQDKFTLILFILLTIAAIIIRRPNFHYTLFFYPALLMLLLRASEAIGRLKGIIVLLLLLLLPQYLYVYSKNHSFDFEKQAQILKTILPGDGLPVIGNGNDWFSFYSRPFYFYNYMGDYTKIGLMDFYLIEDDDYRANYGSMKKWITLHFSGTEVTILTINGQIIKIKKMKLASGSPVSPDAKG
jgi:hypothetical protein